MIDGGRLSRDTINKRSVLSSGRSGGLLQKSWYRVRLSGSANGIGLQKGRCAAAEATRVAPVADQVVQATLPYLPEVVADMVRLQRLTGCRPAEVCILRPCDMDTSADV